MTDGKITKNTLYLTLAYVVQKVLAFVYFALLARYLGVDNIGKYDFALSFVALFSIFIDLGLTSVLIREVAKYKEKAKEYIGNVLGAKMLLAVVTYGIVVLAVSILGRPFEVKQLVYTAGLIMVLDSFTLSFYGVLRGFQKIKFEGLGTILHQLVIVGAGLLFMHFNLPVIYFIIAMLLASLTNFLYSLSLIIFKEKIKIKLELDKTILKKLFIIAVPFAIAGIFSRIYSNIDRVLLSEMLSDTALGIYSVAYKLTFSLQFIPAAFTASIFPAFANFYEHSKEKLAQTFEKSVKYLIVISLPISFGTIALAEELIVKIYGTAYQASALPLQVLIVTLMLIFINYPFGSLLNACDHQKINTRNVGISMLVNIIFNLILIPRLSFVGASLATLVSYSVLIALNLYQTTKIINYDKINLALVFLKSLASAFAMGAMVWFAKGYVDFWWLIVPAGCVYFVLIYVLKIINKEDLNSIFRIFKKKDASFNN